MNWRQDLAEAMRTKNASSAEAIDALDLPKEVKARLRRMRKMCMTTRRGVPLSKPQKMRALPCRGRMRRRK